MRHIRLERSDSKHQSFFVNRIDVSYIFIPHWFFFLSIQRYNTYKYMCTYSLETTDHLQDQCSD